jgi:hypothetical protein
MALQTVLFSVSCVQSAMTSHSAANLKNFSEVFIGLVSLRCVGTFALNVACYAETNGAATSTPELPNAPRGVSFQPSERIKPEIGVP